MNQNERLQQISTAILTLCLNNKRLSGVHRDNLIGNFSNKREAKEVLDRYLVKMDYVRPSDDNQFYKITALGRAYLSQSSTGSVSYSHISNSNIAHQSPNSSQPITLNELPDDIQKMIADFDDATHKNDGKEMMKALGYIADKSVDVAISLITGTLIR